MNIDRKIIRNERKEFIDVGTIRYEVLEDYRSFIDSPEISKGIKVILDIMEDRCNEKIKDYSCKKKIELQKLDIQIKREGKLWIYASPLSYEQIIEKNYEFDDVLHDGNGQTKRGMNGGHWEFLVEKLLDIYAPDKFMAQYIIASPISKAYKKVDFMFKNTKGDKAYISLKRSVRERHRLASDEKSFVEKHLGDSPVYFLTTNRYKKLASSVLDDLKENNVILVTDLEMTKVDYVDRHDVVSFEDFFKEVVPKFVNS